MASITLKGKPINTIGFLPKAGQQLSDFATGKFGKDYQVEITTGPMAHLLSRAVIVADANGKVLYSEQVPEITQEPDYTAALAAL